MSSWCRALIGVTCVLAPVPAHADDSGRALAWAAAGAEIGVAGAIAIHLFTPSSPGKGVGLAVNFLPMVTGVGAAILGEVKDLDPRPPLGFHGALIGGLPLMALGAALDGRNEENGAAFGPFATSLSILGAAGGAFLGATRIDNNNETIAVTAAPFIGALGGGITFAIVHFFDDEGPSSTGRLLRYAGAGMLLGTLGSYAYAFPDRSSGTASMRVAPTVTRNDGATIVSFGGTF